MSVNEQIDNVMNALLPEFIDEFNNGHINHAEETLNKAIKELTRVKYLLKMQSYMTDKTKL